MRGIPVVAMVALVLGLRLRVGERTLMTATGLFRNPPETGAVSI